MIQVASQKLHPQCSRFLLVPGTVLCSIWEVVTVTTALLTLFQRGQGYTVGLGVGVGGGDIPS